MRKIIIFALGLYIVLLNKNIHPIIRKTFNNIFFRIFILFFIVFKENKDPIISILVAFAFILTLENINIISNNKTFELYNLIQNVRSR